MENRKKILEISRRIDDTRIMKLIGWIEPVSTDSTSPPSKTSWTTYVNRCRLSCGRLFRISKEALDQAYQYALDEWEATQPTLKSTRPTVATIANEKFDICLSCASGESYPEEYEIPDFVLNVDRWIDEMSQHAILEIIEDFKKQQIPASVRDYSHLHDFTDANLYGLSVIETLLQDPQTAEYAIEKIANPAQDIVNGWLKGRAAALDRAIRR